jgi:coenzyme PQQ precursor peptide PqqA
MGDCFKRINDVEDGMKEWHKPEVVEEDVGMEVTSYLPAELDKT